METAVNYEILRGNLGAKHGMFTIQGNDMGSSILEFFGLRNTTQYIIEVDKKLYFSGHYENEPSKDQKISFRFKGEFFKDSDGNTEFTKDELKTKGISVNSKSHLFGIFNEHLIDMGFSASSTEVVNSMIAECRGASVKLGSNPFTSSHGPIFKLTYEMNKDSRNHNKLLDEETLISSFKKVSEYINKENSEFIKTEVKKVKVNAKIENIHSLFEKIKEDEISL